MRIELKTTNLAGFVIAGEWEEEMTAVVITGNNERVGYNDEELTDLINMLCLLRTQMRASF